MLQGFHRDFGRGDIRLTDIQVIDLYAFSFCLVGKGNKFADRGSGHTDSPLRNRGHCAVIVSLM
ncbi:hypothetical protein Barb6_02826 [Bacteroidales bacterium Barb6]|nr:hypothetical protein Barb6_02826 [Bacteroidales bacterium Barb6]